MITTVEVNNGKRNFGRELGLILILVALLCVVCF